MRGLFVPLCGACARPVPDMRVFTSRSREVRDRLGMARTPLRAHERSASSGSTYSLGEPTLGLLPSFLLPPDHAKRLEPVLLEWSLGHRGIYAVYPHRRFVPAKVRAFVDFLRAAVGDGNRDPWWPA